MAEPGGGDSLIEVFLSGIDVSRSLGKVSSGFPRPVESLIEMVERKLSLTKPFKINFHPRNYRAHSFIGNIEAYEDRAEIFYDRDQNQCWRRFIVVKEMCHLLFAPFGSKHLASTPEQIEELINKMMAGLPSIECDKDHIVSTESSTILMAIEILLPHSERQNVNDIIAGGGTVLDVARFYLLPEQMVRFYLSKAYLTFMTNSYALLLSGQSAAA